MHYFYNLSLLLILLFTLTSQKESDVDTYKVIYIERFCRYIDWPSNSNNRNSKEFRIGIIGKYSYSKKLNYFFKSIEIKEKKVVLNEIKPSSSLKDYDLIFINQSENDNLDEIIRKTKDLPILLIGDGIDFAKKGVHLNYKVINNQLKFELNLTKLKKTGLKINSKLLEIALEIF